MQRIRFTVLMAVLGAGVSLAQAAPLEVLQLDKSRLGFGYRQMGVSMKGQFPRFTRQLSFDPAKPQAAKASLDIDLRAVDAGGPEANGELQGKDWFNTKAYPTARFVSSSLRSLGNNRFELVGKLSIKGRTQDVLLPLSFKPDGKSGVFDGSLVIKRADFAIGEGPWADFGTVSNEIQVEFHLVAASK